MFLQFSANRGKTRPVSRLRISESTYSVTSPLGYKRGGDTDRRRGQRARLRNGTLHMSSFLSDDLTRFGVGRPGLIGRRTIQTYLPAAVLVSCLV